MITYDPRITCDNPDHDMHMVDGSTPDARHAASVACANKTARHAACGAQGGGGSTVTTYCNRDPHLTTEPHNSRFDLRGRVF